MPVNPRGAGFQVNLKLADWPRIREQFDTQAEAEAYELECRAAHRVGKPQPPRLGKTASRGRVHTMAELVHHCSELHWATLKSGPSLSQNARLFVDWVGPKMPVQEALTAERIAAYVLHRRAGKSKSGSTVNRHLSAISVLATHAAELRLIPGKPKLPWQKEASNRLRWYTQDEEAQILHVLGQWGMGHWADLFIFLVDTGARLGETSQVPWKDIRGRSITFDGTITKNGETRTIALTPRAQDALQRQRALRPTAERPFGWIDRQELRVLWNRLRAYFDWMGDDTVVHTFRHTCASRLVQRGVDLYRVKAWMGHKDISTTMKYAHLAPKHLEELADVLAA